MFALARIRGTRFYPRTLRRNEAENPTTMSLIHQTITVSSGGTIAPKSKRDPRTDLTVQIVAYANGLYKASAAVQGRAKGKNCYYGIKRKRQFLKRLTKFMPTMRLVSPLHVYIKQLQETVDYLSRFASNESNLARFCREHEHDLPAFDAALRLIDDAESVAGDQQLWWKPLTNGTQPIIRFLPTPPGLRLYEHFIENSMTWHEKCAIASGKKRKRGHTSK